MLLYLTVFVLSTMLIFTGKAIADITSDAIHWRRSVFNCFAIDSFFGSKEITSKRKYISDPIKKRISIKNKKIERILNGVIDFINWSIRYLFKTLLVWTTDIWHFANMLNRLGTYFAILFAILIGYKYAYLMNIYDIFMIVLVFAIINTIGFHILYSYVLRKK